MNKEKSFAIIGAGIGGLTLAVALHKKGFKVNVYEKAPVIKPLGAGLALAANAVKALIAIGIANDILNAGKIIKRVAIKDQYGKVLTGTDSEKLSAKYNVVNNFTIHRADLHTLLLNQLPDGVLKLGKACDDFHQDKSGVTVKFSDGTTVHADYVIAADGIHSKIRKRLLPLSIPRFAGYTCWRAVIDNLPDDFNWEETSETWGLGRRFGIVPLTQNRLYWFACINTKAPNSTMSQFSITDLLCFFKDFHHPVELILNRTKTESLIWGDILDIKPIQHFAFGKVLLIGDAAHATTPNMGQGACMAIEDAAILARCLEDASTGEEAFTQFEQKRIKRTTKIVNNSWAIGKMAQLENKFFMKVRNKALQLTPARLAESQVKFLHEINFR